MNYYYDDESYNELIESLNTNLLNIRDDSDGNRYLEPASSFIFEDIKSKEDSQIAVLSLRDPTSEERELIHPIVMYLDTYGNEAINTWDGTAIVVDEGEDQYIFAP